MALSCIYSLFISIVFECHESTRNVTRQMLSSFAATSRPVMVGTAGTGTSAPSSVVVQGNRGISPCPKSEERDGIAMHVQAEAKLLLAAPSHNHDNS
mmetsp:Transcript_90900/g.266146  ORF Transcript_90900/g.266146 Transcript_90900/m.266146 type:complete len:97 (+) Transcript_90900:875-1165(+)